MTDSLLTSKDKKELRGVAQRLKPLVQLGKQGLTPAVVAELDRALNREGLVKVRFNANRADFNSLCEAISLQLSCECVGGVGLTASFYRRKKEPGSES